MELRVSQNPAATLAQALQDAISGPTLITLAGGSALSLFDELEISDPVFADTYWVMGDERYTTDPASNNYLQLPPTVREQTNVLDTSVHTGEQLAAYTKRLNQQLAAALRRTDQVISILGIGTDGHTAGIFPMSEANFQATYDQPGPYISAHVADQALPERVSLTPQWFLKNSDKVFAYATGPEKVATIRTLIHTTKPTHEQPAQILNARRDSYLFTDYVAT